MRGQAIAFLREIGAELAPEHPLYGLEPLAQYVGHSTVPNLEQRMICRQYRAGSVQRGRSSLIPANEGY
jgi:hypothetical protein